MILHVPHASRALTDRAGLLPGGIEDELDHLTDAYTDRIARRAADASAVRPWIFENRCSRLVVDPERFPDDREEMRAVGMGAVYTHGYAGRRLRDDDPVRDEDLLRTHYRPYAAAMTDLVAARLAATGRAVVVDVHSYPTVALPYELHAAGPRPPVCLGTDDFHTPAASAAAATTVFAAFQPLRDTPFAGCYVPLRYYRQEPAVTALMIEIRRDTYMAEPGGAPNAGLDRLARTLAELVDRL
ncbi:N-formylglutamate amidohydrolase [Micromonosporaceae bacterium Da 78-11]